MRTMFKWIIIVAWLLWVFVVKDQYGWAAVGMYILGSVLYAGYVLLVKESEEEE